MPKPTVKDYRKMVKSMLDKHQKPEINPIDQMIEMAKKEKGMMDDTPQSY